MIISQVSYRTNGPLVRVWVFNRIFTVLGWLAHCKPNIFVSVGLPNIFAPEQNIDFVFCDQYIHISYWLIKKTNNLHKAKTKVQISFAVKADQRLCFRYTDSMIRRLLKSERTSCKPASVTVQLSLCRTWLEPR